LAAKWVDRLSSELGIKIFALADTVGMSNVQNIKELFETIIPSFSGLEIGAHLHTTSDEAEVKVEACLHAGCTRFDAAIMGYGGCPMAEDDLVGNLATESLLETLKKREKLGLNMDFFAEAMQVASSTFPN